MDDAPYLSVVVPFFNEEESVQAVCLEVGEALAPHRNLVWELVMVDDGSTDSTPRIIDRLAREKKIFRALHIHPHSGQSAALEAGFRAARGEVVATLDGDSQNDPRDLPGLMSELERTGVHMVCGIRQERSDTLVRRLSGRIANRVRSAVLKDGVVDVGCSLRVFRRDCLDQVRFFRNAHRFFPALFVMSGFTVSQVPVSHRPRRHGTSKYGGGINSRLWAGIVDLAGVYWLRKRALSYTAVEGK